MLISTDAIKPVVPVYQLITCIHPSPFEIHVYKCLGQIFKRDYLILDATDDTGHIIQDLSWATASFATHRENVLPTNGLCTNHKPVGKLWRHGHKLHLILDFRLFAWSTFCLGLPALDLLLGFDTSMPTLPHKTAAREEVMVPMYLILG